MHGWSGKLPERITRPVMDGLNEGLWFRYSLASPDRNGGPAVGKIKTIRSPKGGRVVVLWLDADAPERISIQVYSADDDENGMMVNVRWLDGYAVGHPVEDEDDIYRGDGSLDEAALIAVIYESLENMEYSFVGRKELMTRWSGYRNGEHLNWPNEPWTEGGEEA